MRKLGLVLILLFTLSIVSAADFTISGKITPKTGVSSIGDGSYDTEFSFSNGFTWNAAEKQSPVKITMTNGVFTADLSDIPNVASVIAASETVTMEVSVFGGLQTFSNIPLTTVPKALYATTAGSAYLTNGEQQLEINLNSETHQGTADSTDEFWHIRSGGNSALPTVFSYQGSKQLQLDNALSTFYGELNVLGITKLSNRIYQDTGTTDDNYDIWIQGSKTIASSSDHNRNLALLGQANTDTLYLNYNGEYEAGTIIGSLTSPTTIKGALTAGATNLGVTSATSYDTTGKTTTGTLESGTTVLGATTATSLTHGGYLTIKDYDKDATHSRLYSRDNVLVSQGNTKVLGDLEVSGNLAVTGFTTETSSYSENTGAGANAKTYVKTNLGVHDFCAVGSTFVDGNNGAEADAGKIGKLGCNVWKEDGTWFVGAYASGQSADKSWCRANCFDF
jgi:hypothetical protein